jgi:hypothetical protein
MWVGGNLPLGYKMNDGKIAVVEEEAELVRSIFRRYLELGSVNELVRDLRERNIRTKSRLLSTGVTRGGILFGRGALYYVLSNHFYIGEVKYKNEILPGEQPPIMDRGLFEAVRQKSLAQWSHRTTVSFRITNLSFTRPCAIFAKLTGFRFLRQISILTLCNNRAALIEFRELCRPPFHLLHGLPRARLIRSARPLVVRS